MKTAIKKNAITALIIGIATCLALIAAAIGLGPIAARAEDKTLVSVEYKTHQIIPYGAVVADVIDDNAKLVYSDGSKEDVKIKFGDITAYTGVNVNYTTVTVKGEIEETGTPVSVDITTMPEDLVYFINCGSNAEDGKYADTADPFVSYNDTVHAYYGDKLINKIPDQGGATKGGDKWGYYTSATYTAPGDATFPYNTLLWTDTAIDMGYMLTGLEANGKYRITLGTLSAWHARTVSISFNGSTIGTGNLRIASKNTAVYENVAANAQGRMDIYMKGESTNEPCVNFIAVQPMSVEVAAVPADLVTGTTVGVEDHTLTFTGGAQAGAKIQLYNASKPNQIMYEEMVDAEKIGGDGSYTIDFGSPITDVSQFYCVQITNGGVSAKPALVAVTDIRNFGYTLTPDDYTTGTVTVTVTAQAASGMVKWSYKQGEYGVVNEFEIGKQFRMAESFTVTENGDYYVVVTSGLGVTYSDVITVSNIDASRPSITVLPSGSGWKNGAYNVSIKVETKAPVSSYVLYKDGAQVTSANSVPSNVTFTGEGYYTIAVTNATGLSTIKSVSVKNKPTTTVVTKSFVSRTLKYKFEDNEDYEIASVSAYQLRNGSASRATIASGNVLDVYSAGTYVVTITTTNGETEMFAINPTASEVRTGKVGVSIGGSGLSKETTLGVGLGVGLGGAVIAGVLILLVLVVFKKKKPAVQSVTANGETAVASEENAAPVVHDEAPDAPASEAHEEAPEVPASEASEEVPVASEESAATEAEEPAKEESKPAAKKSSSGGAKKSSSGTTKKSSGEGTAKKSSSGSSTKKSGSGTAKKTETKKE